MLKAPFLLGGLLSCLPLTNFIGRQKELDEIKSLLATTRLLTLTGTGGCGKTRIAFRVAAGLVEEFKHGVCWVSLATLADSALVPQMVISALGIPEQPGRSLRSTLLDYLRCKTLLLVLDGCEHMIEACSQQAEELLRVCPHLRIMITSRQIMNVAGETIYSIPPLSLPPPISSSLEDAMKFEACQLFAERAASARPSFMVTKRNILSVIQVCRSLDGIPLAIELAAARVRMLSMEQIVTQLSDYWHLLTSGSRTALPQHQTLRASMDWSYVLLSKQERILFHRLSVFAEDFSLKAAEVVCSGGNIVRDEILDLLSRLVDKSLVTVEEQKSEVRYRLLDTIRQYGQDWLQKQEERDIVRRKHRDWYLNMAKQAEPEAEAELTRHGARINCLPMENVTGVRDRSELRILTLGTTKVLRDKYALVSANWKYIKSRELLFYLLCHSSKTKEQIGLELWPDASPAQLRDSFHSALYHLRHALGRPDWVVCEHYRYSFNHRLSYWFDVEIFERHLTQARKFHAQAPTQAISHLEKGIKLYQGNFLEDSFDSTWHLLRQKELQKMYADALMTLGQLFFAEGQYVQAADAYQQLIAHDNFQEVAHRELMRCYGRQGEGTLVLRHYRTLLAMLYDEFGSFPTEETTALFERLCRGDAV